jgi:hypothetical protein
MRLFALPLSLARLPLKVAGTAISLVESLVRPTPTAPAPTTPPPEPRFVRADPPRRRAPAVANGVAPPAAPRQEPAHVSEEPVVVAETAERGAEEGAGAEVHVDEPWPGYRDMTAAQIRQRLRAASPAEAAAVSLYEAGGKGRSSVLEEAAKRTGA